jgi:hypothetical protein
MIGLLMLACEMVRGVHAAPLRSASRIELSDGRHGGREGGCGGGNADQSHTGHSLVPVLPDQTSQSVPRGTGRKGSH